MKITINVAGIRIHISSAASFKISRKLACFSSNESSQIDLNVSLINCLDIPVPDNTLLLDEKMQWGRNNSKAQEISIYVNEEEANKAVNQLKVNRSWNNALITYTENKEDILLPFLGSLGEILFRNCILFHQGIVIHAAAIEWQGKGIMFSAPSETGKTTQANLWRKNKGAKIINADRPAVRVAGNHSYLYGTLWNGSSSKYRNRSVPLSAIILLEQAKENKIRKLDNKEAAARLIPRCFLPYYQEDIMNLALDNIEKIIAVTPVYILQCRPDKEAVELVYQCLK
ncbi:MAG: hypothetical protein WCD89_18810 [Anaerocolumna sp.]